MCGIAGIISLRIDGLQQPLHDMSREYRRGTDGAGMWSQSGVAFAAHRFSITTAFHLDQPESNFRNDKLDTSRGRAGAIRTSGVTFW